MKVLAGGYAIPDSGTDKKFSEASGAFVINGANATFNNIGEINATGATMPTMMADAEGTQGFVLSSGVLNNSGVINAKSGNTATSYGFYQTGGTFTNSGTLNAIASNSDPMGDETSAFMLEGGELINEVGGIIKVTGSARDDTDDYAFHLGSGNLTNKGTIEVSAEGPTAGFYITASDAVVTNSGSFVATASGANSMGVSMLGLGTFANAKGGRITFAADGDNSIGIDFGGTIENQKGATITVTADGDGALGFWLSGGTVNNSGTIDAKVSGNATAINLGGGELINKSDGVITVAGGSIADTMGIYGGAGTFENQAGGVVTLKGGSVANSYGYFLNDRTSSVGSFTNAGTLNLESTVALNALYASKFNQTESTGLISGNLLSYTDYSEDKKVIAQTTKYLTDGGYKKVDKSSFNIEQSTLGIGSMANFGSSSKTPSLRDGVSRFV